MKLNEVFSGDYLKAEDLKGSSPTVTIESVEVKEFTEGDGKSKKLILHFVGKDKSLVANKTNSNIIAEVLGSDDTDDWGGRRITLTTRKVEFQGKLVPAIRVSLDGPVGQKVKAPAPPPVDVNDDSEVPF